MSFLPDFRLFFRLQSCEKAYKHWQNGTKPIYDESSFEWVDDKIKKRAISWFLSRDVVPHQLSQKKLQNGSFEATIDQVVELDQGYRLEKIAFFGSPTASVKNELTLQYMLLKEQGIDIKEVFLYLPTKNANSSELFDFENIFQAYDLTFAVIAKSVELTADQARSDELSASCLAPIECPYKRYCFEDVPRYSVLNIARMHTKKRFDLLNSGIKEIADIPENYKLTRFEKIQVLSEKNNSDFVDAEMLASFLAGFEFPLYFLDFETIQHAIAPFENLRPFEPLVFQYSICKLKSFDSEVESFTYLADPAVDERSKIADDLANIISDGGMVVAYGAGFERSIIKKLVPFCSEPEKLESIGKRVADLMIPFEKRWYYHPKIEGACSLKKVAPSFDESLAYDDLVVGSGKDAMDWYLQLASADEKEAKNIRENLIKYNYQDTYSLVIIYKKLCEIATKGLLDEYSK